MYVTRLQNSRFFLKISKAWRKSLTRAKPRSLFSASFQTFCLTARAYLNTQKYGLFCSLVQSKVQSSMQLACERQTFLLAHRRWGTSGETSVFAGLFVTRTSKYTGTSSAVRVYNFFQLLWVPLGKWIYAFLFLWFKMWRISFLALFFIPKNVRRDCESVIEFDWISVSKVTSGLVFHLYHVGRSPIKSINDRCLFNMSLVISLSYNAGFYPWKNFFENFNMTNEDFLSHYTRKTRFWNR